MTERVAIFVSGEGSTMEAVAPLIKDGGIPGISLAGVIASRHDLPAIRKASNLNITYKISNPENYRSPQGKLREEVYGLDIIYNMEALEASIGMLMGWKEKLPDNVIEKFKLFAGTHPGPLSETAKGYGLVPYVKMRKFSELTGRNEGTEVVVQRLYPGRGWDEGTILARRRVPIYQDDTAEKLQKRGKFHEVAVVEEVLRNYVRHKGEIPEEEQVAFYMKHGEEILLEEADSWAREYVKSKS